MRKIIAVLICGLLLCGARGGLTTDQPSSQFQSVLKMGGGGWNVGLDICTDGTRYFRTDTYGAYRYDTTVNTQLVTQASMPAANFGYFPATGTSQINQSKQGGGGSGVYEITSAPSACSTVYMMFNGWLYKSTNRGTNWTNISSLTGVAGTSFGGQTTAVPMASNSASRTGGRKMAVDPLNPSIVFAGTDTLGLFVSRDGGNTWGAVSGVPTASGSVNYNIAFDPSSATITCPTVGGSCTSGIYAYTNGSTAGVYLSTDGGVTWAIAASSGPASVQHMVVGSTGVVWACSGAANTNGTLYRLKGGAWATQSSACHSVAVDPADHTHIIAASAFGLLNITNTGDATTPTWSGTTTLTLPFIASSPNPPWLGADVLSLSNGDTIFDPTLSNTLLMGEGVGPWITNPQTGTTQWTSLANGIEQMVSRAVIAPNGTAVVGVSDRGTFQLSNPASYPANYNNAYGNSFALTATSALDYVSASISNMVSINGDITGAIPNNINSGVSTDGGATWKQFNNGFYYQIAAANLTGTVGGTSGLIRVTVPSTTVLVAWTAGTTARNSIVRLINYGGAPTTARAYYEITNVTATTFDLLNSTYTTPLSAAGNYEVYVDTNPLSDIDGLYSVSGTSSSSGLVRVGITNTGVALSNNIPVCISGVGGTTEANGCWVTTNIVNGVPGSADLLGSTFVNAWTSGGTVTKPVPPGGSIATASPTDIMYIPANEDYPQCSTDGGKTWTQIRQPTGVAAGGDTGWVHDVNINRRIAAADRTLTNRFFLFNVTSASNTSTIYTVDSCSVTATATSTTAFSNFSATLLSVPGYAGELLLSIGTVGTALTTHPVAGSGLRWTNNPAANNAWTLITNTSEPLFVAAGAIAPGSDHPTIYFVGWMQNQNTAAGCGIGVTAYCYGVWRSTSTSTQWAANNVTWTKVGDYPLGSMDIPFTLTADGVTWNKWYLGWVGSSFTYGQQN